MTVITRMPVDQNGHWIAPKGMDTLDVIQIEGMPAYVSDAYSRCAVCDWCPVFDVADGRVRAKEPCPMPDGITTVVEVAFPSGRIIVTDDLRPVYDWADADCPAGYNSALGQAQAVKSMAARGCAYGPVSNTCPNLYRLPDPGRFVIATPSWNGPFDDDDDGEGEEFSLSIPGAEKVADICTDLWAYSICDHDDYLARGGDPGNLKRWTWTVVDVAPGVYRFTHHTGERAFDYGARELIFADIERIGDCA